MGNVERAIGLVSAVIGIVTFSLAVYQNVDANTVWLMPDMDGATRTLLWVLVFAAVCFASGYWSVFFVTNGNLFLAVVVGAVAAYAAAFVCVTWFASAQGWGWGLLAGLFYFLSAAAFVAFHGRSALGEHGCALFGLQFLMTGIMFAATYA